MKTTRRLALVAVNAAMVVCATVTPASAQSRCAPRQVTPVELRALDLESLLNVEVITASKFSESQSDAPGIISVVSQDELRRFGGTTLREVLERVPGLASSTAYFTDRSMVAARGDQTKINGGHVLFLINGRPTREVLEGGLVSDLLESFPINVLERIEVIKGPGSVLYGSNAFSAVVNLITLEDKANGFSFGGAPGTAGARQVSGEGTYSCGDLHIVGGAQLHQRPDWNTTYWFNNPDDPFAAGVPSEQDVTIRDRSRGGYVGVNYHGLSVTTSFTEWRTAAFVRGTVGENRWRRGLRGRRIRIQRHPALEDERQPDLHAQPLRYPAVPVHHPRLERDVARVDQFREPDVARPVDVRRLAQPRGRSRDVLRSRFPDPHLERSPGRRGLRAARPPSRRRPEIHRRLPSEQDRRSRARRRPARRRHLESRGTRPRQSTLRRGISCAEHQRNDAKPSEPERYVNVKPEKVATFDLELSYHGDRIQGTVNYFHSKQTDSIVVDATEQRWRYRNSGEATFQGVELEGKYYVNGTCTCSARCCTSRITTVTAPRTSRPCRTRAPRAGSVFRTSAASRPASSTTTRVPQRLLVDPESRNRPRGICSARTPGSTSAALFTSNQTTGVALVINADNLTNDRCGSPIGAATPATLFQSRRGRTVYVGVEMSVGRRTSSRAASLTQQA